MCQARLVAIGHDVRSVALIQTLQDLPGPLSDPGVRTRDCVIQASGGDTRRSVRGIPFRLDRVTIGSVRTDGARRLGGLALLPIALFRCWIPCGCCRDPKSLTRLLVAVARRTRPSHLAAAIA